MIAQVDEQHAAMVALAVDPARQSDGLADLGGGQLAAFFDCFDNPRRPLCPDAR